MSEGSSNELSLQDALRILGGWAMWSSPQEPQAKQRAAARVVLHDRLALIRRIEEMRVAAAEKAQADAVAAVEPSATQEISFDMGDGVVIGKPEAIEQVRMWREFGEAMSAACVYLDKAIPVLGRDNAERVRAATDEILRLRAAPPPCVTPEMAALLMEHWRSSAHDDQWLIDRMLGIVKPAASLEAWIAKRLAETKGAGQ